MQPFFHLAFVIVFGGMMAIRAFYYRKAHQHQGPVTYLENRMTRLRRTLGLTFPFLLLAYIFYPALLSRFTLGLPIWAQWLGLAIGVLSLGLTWWVQWALDINFSDVLHVREEHTLVRHGPYRWVRHPMDTTIFLNGIAVLLPTRNWLFGGFYLMSLTLIVAFRVRNEEHAMIERFGQPYREYMRRNNRFLPRLR